MVTKVQKWGNSKGLRLNKKLLEDAHISIGDEVDVTVSDGVILISPVKRVRGKYSLQQLITCIPANYSVEETSWGHPEGKEAW